MNILNTAENIGYNFAEEQAYKIYEAQIRSLRESLLGNKISYIADSESEVDKAIKKYNTKVYSYSLFFRTLNQLKNEEINQEITDYFSNDVEQRRKELEKLKYKNWDRNFSQDNIDNEQETRRFWEETHGPDEITSELTSSGFESNIFTFPVPGEKISTHDTENGKRFINRAKYETNSNGQKGTIFKGWTKFGVIDPDKYSTPSNPMSDKVARMVEEYRKITPGSYKFFIEKLHGRSVNGSSFGKNPIKKGKTKSDYPNRMVFPAYISTFNDSYDSEWNSYNFIGRGEKVYIYNNTQRKLTLEFYLISDFSSELLLNAIEEERIANNPTVKALQAGKLNFSQKDLNSTSFTSVKDMVTNYVKNGNVNKLTSLSKEDALSELQRLLPDWGLGAYPISGIINGEYTGVVGGQLSGTPEMLWARLTFLAQCIYPWYRRDGKLKEQPFVRIRIGDFIDCIAKIDSLSLSEYDSFDMDLNESPVGAIPMGVKVALTMTIVHEDEPTSNYSRFYWRKDFDKEAHDYTPLSLSETSTFLDPTLDSKKTGSAMMDINPATPFGESQNSFPKEQIQNLEEKSKFNSSLKKLKESFGSLNTSQTAILKTVLLTAKRLLEAKAIAKASKLENVNAEEIISYGGMAKDITSKTSQLIPKSQEDPSKPEEAKERKKRKLFKNSESNV